MRVIVSGSRDWNDADAVRRFLSTLHAHDTIVEGGARGLDRMVRDMVLDEGWPFHLETHWANWNFYGKAAGSIRNERMASLGADLLAIFPLPQSKGTWHMKTQAEKRGIVVVRGDRTE